MEYDPEGRTIKGHCSRQQLARDALHPRCGPQHPPTHTSEPSLHDIPSYPHFLGPSEPENLLRFQCRIVLLAAIAARDEHVFAGICGDDPMKPEACVRFC